MHLFSYKPITVENIFAAEEYEQVYKAVNHVFDNDLKFDETGPGYFPVDGLGYFAVVGLSDENVYQKVKDVVEEATGLQLEYPQIHFARYTLKTGHVPQLKPHYDVMLKKDTITLSIQMDATLPWSIYANGVKADLPPNSGIIFSGSHQYHWRPEIEFKDDDYYDIMVCQMTIVGAEDLSDNHENFMSSVIYPPLALKGF
jgi:hypothetical protein